MSARSFDFNKNAFPQIKEYAQTLKDIRRDFHKNPEIGLVTPQTSGKIASLLRSFGVDEVHEGIGGCGVVGVVRGARPGSLRVGLRADIDALPMAELSSHDHVSQISGCMHACGHDGHAAVLLGAAKYLAETRGFPGEVVLIFQPGEEGWSGAKHMIDDGLFDRFPVAEVYALHNSSALEPGKIALNYGAMQAAADAFTITVKGKGGHASRPQMNHDPVLASAHVIVALQSIVSREVDPLETAVVSCCSLQAGDPRAQSVCPETCQIVGTARTFSPEVRDLVEKRIGEISACIAAGLGCEAQTKYERFYPPVINTPAQAKILADIAADLVGKENVDRSYPRMAGGEDFAFMLEKVPGAYIRIGQGGAPAHNPYFDYNDDVTPLAATLLAAAAEQRLHALNGAADEHV